MTEYSLRVKNLLTKLKPKSGQGNLEVIERIAEFYLAKNRYLRCF